MGLPFTPAVVPAPSGTRDQHLLVKPDGRMDSRPAALPSKPAANYMTRAFSCRDVSPPTNLVCRVGGRGLLACDSKPSANSRKDTCRCISGKLSSLGSHCSSESQRNMAGKKSGPHF